MTTLALQNALVFMVFVSVSLVYFVVSCRMEIAEKKKLIRHQDADIQALESCVCFWKTQTVKNHRIIRAQAEVLAERSREVAS